MRTHLLSGSAGRQTHRRHRDAGIVWIARWGYTTPNILCLHIGIGQDQCRRLVAGLIKAGLAAEIRALDGYTRYETENGTRKILGPFLLCLTRDGLAVADFLDELPHAGGLSDIPAPMTIRHNLSAQRVAATILKKQPDYQFQTEFALRRTHCHKGKKIPDFTLIDPDGSCIAVEVELTRKNGSTLDRALSACALSIYEKEYSQSIWIFANDSIREFYNDVWSRPIRKWKRRSNGQWEPDGHFKDHSDVRGKVQFKTSAILQEAVRGYR